MPPAFSLQADCAEEGRGWSGEECRAIAGLRHLPLLPLHQSLLDCRQQHRQHGSLLVTLISDADRKVPAQGATQTE
eukprot:1161341-Pelagomonas_calceolata.AAC.16